MLMYLNRCSPLKPSLNIYVFQWEIRIDTALQEKEKFLPLTCRGGRGNYFRGKGELTNQTLEE